MFELQQIILWILWRLRPVMAVEANLVDIIAAGFRLFDSDEAIIRMEDDPSQCLIVSAGLADAHTKLDLLIYLRACEIIGIRSRAKDFTPNRTASRSGRTPQACWTSFRRLVTRFEDYERLAQKRAEGLRAEQSPLRLAAALQSTSPMLCMVEATHRGLFAVQIAFLTPQEWGTWIARTCAQNGGGLFAQPRGPPSHPESDFTHTHLAGSTCGNALTRPSRETPQPSHPPAADQSA